ncbi:MAG: hypothetical protein AAGG02_10680 [Cyanobacteria bacterium P01_H01_bin.15]
MHGDSGSNLLLELTGGAVIEHLGVGFSIGNPAYGEGLEDQARRIVLQLWREMVLWIRQTKGLEAALNGQLVTRELAKVLGLVPVEGEVCPEISTESVRVEPEVAARVKMPLAVPRFGKERLRVLLVLEQLRQGGVLRQKEAMVFCQTAG